MIALPLAIALLASIAIILLVVFVKPRSAVPPWIVESRNLEVARRRQDGLVDEAYLQAQRESARALLRECGWQQGDVERLP